MTQGPNEQDEKRKINCYLTILDKSGSMGAVVEETISGFNEQVQMLKEITRDHPDQDYFTSLVSFNHELDYMFFNADADELDEITEDDYDPDGMTALWDAIGLSINRMRREMKKELKDEDVQVFVNIFTDGQENSSNEFAQEQIADLIKDLEETKKWKFTFIGADREGVLQGAHGLGIADGSIASYAQGKVGTKAAIRGLAATMRCSTDMRSLGKTFADKDYDNMMADTYSEAYQQEVNNLESNGLDAKAVWDKTKEGSKGDKKE